MTVRSPAVAGLFYPREPRRLQADLDALLAAVAPAEAPPPKAVIAPHAGPNHEGPAAFNQFTSSGRIGRAAISMPSSTSDRASSAVALPMIPRASASP